MANSDITSDELAAGIAAYDIRIAPLLGRTVTVCTPDGLRHTGTFGEAGKCQPIVTQQDGRRFSVSAEELDRLVAEVTGSVCTPAWVATRARLARPESVAEVTG